MKKYKIASRSLATCLQVAIFSLIMLVYMLAYMRARVLKALL
jgi:hypothetical protein